MPDVSRAMGCGACGAGGWYETAARVNLGLVAVAVGRTGKVQKRYVERMREGRGRLVKESQGEPKRGREAVAAEAGWATKAVKSDVIS